MEEWMDLCSAKSYSGAAARALSKWLLVRLCYWDDRYSMAAVAEPSIGSEGLLDVYRKASTVM